MKIAVLIPNGFEEIEAITPIDILRRADLTVTTFALEANPAQGSHGIDISCDEPVENLNTEDFDLLFLPGGLPGSHTLRDSEIAQAIIKDFAKQSKYIAAICAAPVALHKAGLLDGKSISSHPSKEAELTNTNYSQERVTVDGKIITSRGAGTAIEFSLCILEELGLKEKAQTIKQAILA